LLKHAPKPLLKEYIRGFHDAEGSTDHLYHSWFTDHECPPLQFITRILTTQFEIRTTNPMRLKTDKKFNRYPAYQIYIHDYSKFKTEILGKK